MKFKLDQNHELFKALAKKPLWWENLKSDKGLYIDLRKDNSLNVYHNGGSLMKLEWKKGYVADVHRKYVPLKSDRRSNLPYHFGGADLVIPDPGLIEIDNFSAKVRGAFKERIRKHFENTSEKGIQGAYVVKSRRAKTGGGFFIDSEFAYGDTRKNMMRIDLVWTDFETKRIAFVELKTIGDERLMNPKNPKSIVNQMKTYGTFIRSHEKDLLRYYDILYRIRRKLGINPDFANVTSLAGFKIVDKPILLVGDCTRDWIKMNADSLNKKLTGIAFGCICRGIGSQTFRIPDKTRKHDYKL